MEGLYLLSEEWDVKEMFDVTIFIDADIDKCMERLKIRNKVIPGYTEEEVRNCEEKIGAGNALILLTSPQNHRHAILTRYGQSSNLHATRFARRAILTRRSAPRLASLAAPRFARRRSSGGLTRLTGSTQRRPRQARGLLIM